MRQKQHKLHEFEGHECLVKTIKSSPLNGHLFATGGMDGRIHIYDISKIDTEL